MEDYTNWNHDEFLTFVLIHAALADFEIQDEEHDIISIIVPEKRFKGLLKFHKGNKDFENINIILKLKDKFCSTEEEKQKVCDEIKTVFDSDGDYNLYERNMDMALNLILASK